MNAIDIIYAMTFDSDLAESSSVWKFFVGDVADQWIRNFFGSFHIKEGDLLPGHYLTIWQCDALDLPFKEHNKPDVTLTRNDPGEADEDDQEVYLWRVDE